eukprot:scaffold3774_cov148-Skeletonema_marinoi.AAC.2
MVGQLVTLRECYMPHTKTGCEGCEWSCLMEITASIPNEAVCYKAMKQRNDTTLPWGVTKTLISPTIEMAIRASSAVWRQDPIAIPGLVLICTSFHNVK